MVRTLYAMAVDSGLDVCAFKSVCFHVSNGCCEDYKHSLCKTLMSKNIPSANPVI